MLYSMFLTLREAPLTCHKLPSTLGKQPITVYVLKRCSDPPVAPPEQKNTQNLVGGVKIVNFAPIFLLYSLSKLIAHETKHSTRHPDDSPAAHLSAH